MPRVTLTAQPIVLAGLEPVYVAAEVDGNAFLNTGAAKKFVHVKNGAVACNVTFVTVTNIIGLDLPDMVILVPATEERMIGPFHENVFNQSNGLVHINYDDVTNVTVAVLSIA